MNVKNLGRPHILLTSYRLEYRYVGNNLLGYVFFKLRGKAYKFRQAVHSPQPMIIHRACLRLGGAVCIVADDFGKPGLQQVMLAGEHKVVKKEKFPGYTWFITREPWFPPGSEVHPSFFNCPTASSMKFYLRAPKIRILEETLIAILTCKGFWLENYNLLHKVMDEVKKRFDIPGKPLLGA